jgi:hypothetical protein
MRRAALRAPAALGKKRTCTSHEAPTASVVPVHVSPARKKSSGFVPAVSTRETVSVPLDWLLVTVTVCGDPAVPWAWDPNARLDGDAIGSVNCAKPC